MVELTKNKKCIFVVGPTASGKSQWALEQAELCGGSIVNIDSVQFYKGLEVGSAAPTLKDLQRVPHYLYSYKEAPYEMTAGQYIKEFYKLLEEPIKFPLFIVGGTGFYIQALEKGMFDVEPVPIEVRESLEQELKVNGSEKLYSELLASDPQTKIHQNDHYRLVRALEIIRHTGKIPTELNKENKKNKNEFPFSYIKIGFDFDKKIYEERVKKRTVQMLAGGIIEETKKILDAGYGNWAPMQSVGFKETAIFIKENKTQTWLMDSVCQSTMKLIKKQKTWFKRDDAILWSNQSAELKHFLSSV